VPAGKRVWTAERNLNQGSACSQKKEGRKSHGHNPGSGKKEEKKEGPDVCWKKYKERGHVLVIHPNTHETAW